MTPIARSPSSAGQVPVVNSVPSPLDIEDENHTLEEDSGEMEYVLGYPGTPP